MSDILDVFPNFVFNILRCHYFEIIDPVIQLSDLEGKTIDSEILPRFVLDLTTSEDELFANMKPSCRRLIRQSIKNGIKIEEACDETFADDYYAQLTEVFAKQSLVPPFSLERVRKLVELMIPTGNLLLLRAREPSGKCIATHIFLGLNRSVISWGAASWREFQYLRPNEAIIWYAIKYWKAKGIKEFHLGGGWRQYKSKYGCDEIAIIRVMKTKYKILERLRIMFMSSRNPKLRNWVIRRF